MIILFMSTKRYLCKRISVLQKNYFASHNSNSKDVACITNSFFLKKQKSCNLTFLTNALPSDSCRSTALSQDMEDTRLSSSCLEVVAGVGIEVT